LTTFSNPLQQVVQFDKYAKYIPELQRRETWEETTQRVIDFFEDQLHERGMKLENETWAELTKAMLNLEALPSMRIVQMAGPALERCNVGGYNCAYTPLAGPQDLAELLYILMQGTGCGFSVESKYINQWPQIKETESVDTFDFSVPDTTEGWCQAFRMAIEAALDGRKMKWDYSKIRPEGSWLNTKGGRASGPKPLKELLDATWTIIRNRAGNNLRPFDVHRLACKAGAIVQVGGVRRSALISLSDPSDVLMRDCKRGAFWDTYPELSQANNSAVYENGRKITTHEWDLLATSGTGERGIFRRPEALPNRDRFEWGTNPCGEIILRPKQFCNLSQAVAREDDTAVDLERKVRIAAIFGTIQSALTKFNYLSPEWTSNSNAERLLGVDITGARDCEILRVATDETARLLRRLRETAIATNKEFAAKLGLEPSRSVTCNKPSGNSSQLLNCSSGIHPRYAQFYIRRIRLGSITPLSEYLKQRGVPWERESDSVSVFSFPIASPINAINRHSVNAVEQFFYWLMWKQNWTTHNPSCTIYVNKNEWGKLGMIIERFWNEIGGLSFLPSSDHVYKMAPYEQIDEAEYQARIAVMPNIDLSQIVEIVDNTTLNQDYACEGDKCLWEPKT
jgi:ribonucleoside-triphosphate reductase